MSEENSKNAPSCSSLSSLRPSLTFESITFSDGTTINLDDDDLVVFVGPNNAGKSAALRELESFIGKEPDSAVVKSVNIKKVGTSDDLMSFLEKNALKTEQSGNITYGGIGYNIARTLIHFFDDPMNRHLVAPFFTKRLKTETRIQDSGAAPTIALFRNPPTHPIHMLLMDDSLAADISRKFRHAFGADLTVFRAGGGSFPLYVGEKPALKAGKDELSREFVDNLRRTNVELDEQGDGMRSFSAVILNVLAADTHSIQFLDEPEAFLHPPQARLLGKYIAENRRQKSQLFVATHSTDILDGLIEGGSDKVRIIRLRRSGNVNHVKELGKAQTKAVARDTLTRFARVFDGIFYEHVIVCESDADCMFYQSLLNLSSISGDRRPDVLFVHTSGKHRMAQLADTLRALDVPVSVIADVDVLSEQGTFRTLVEKLGANWADLARHWKAISEAVTSLRPSLNASQIASMISDEIRDVKGTAQFPSAKEAAIKRIFKTVSPWSGLKQSGRDALPGGEATRHFDELLKKCSIFGLWIVPVGELEGFCRSMGAHGPGFVEKVLEERNLETDSELEVAREFIQRLWRQARPSDPRSDTQKPVSSA